MTRKSFHGIMGEEYKLISLACPHLDGLQDAVGRIINNQFISSDQKIIRVLEVGCGYGRTTMAILDFEKRSQIIAIDNESKMISQAEGTLKKFINNGRVKLAQADALSFLKKQSDNSFDVFASALTIHNFTDKDRKLIVKQIYRVLRPGGLFVNMDKYALDDNLKHHEALKERLKRFKEVYSKINRPDLVAGWTAHYLDDDRPEIIMRESESLELMKEIGFRDIKITNRRQIEAILICKKTASL